MAVSRTGTHWAWPDREKPFIPLGQSGDFDGGSLYMANGACVPTGDDQLSFYFSGSTLKHEEVLDEHGKPIPGRSVEDCQALTRDDLSWTVSWANGDDVTAWSGTPIHLRLELQDADVFGFHFSGK